MTHVALVQLDVSTYEPFEQRAERAERLIEGAAGAGAEFIVLPELWPAGAFELEAGIALAEPIGGPITQRLAALAGRLGVWLHGGSIVEDDGPSRWYNTSLVFDPDGQLAGIYRKIHLFSMESSEARLFQPGSDIVVIDTVLGPTGLATCYDLRFPELFRALIDKGATSVVITSGWPIDRVSRWSVLAQARAIENVVNLAGCNQTGRQGHVVQGGHSIVCDPLGDVLAEADGGEEVLHADLDPDRPAAVRGQLPVLRDRRLR